MEDEKIKAIKNRYGKLAKDAPACSLGCSSYGTSSCAPPKLDLGCGKPVPLANLKPGETVLDLGSGAGLDAIFAAQDVGEEGKVIGVDMTPEMIEEASRAAAQAGYRNIEHRLGEIEKLPVEGDSIDVVISNCVINLALDKSKVFSEAYRVLRPGGRMVVSDIVAEKELPAEIIEDPGLWSECVSGALPEETYLFKIRDAGFEKVRVVSRGPLRKSHKAVELNLSSMGVNLSSIIVEAYKSKD